MKSPKIVFYICRYPLSILIKEFSWNDFHCVNFCCNRWKDVWKICENDSSQLILSLTIISFQWFAEHAWLSRFTIFFPEYDLRHLKKKTYPDIIGFTIFSTYTQKINQGLLQNWWIKTLFERVIKFMNNSWRLTKYNFISKYLVKTEQV